MRKVLSIVFLFLIFLFSACYYDKAQLVYPAVTACDTASVKFSTTLIPILNASCNSCHGGNAAAGAGIAKAAALFGGFRGVAVTV